MRKVVSHNNMNVSWRKRALHKPLLSDEVIGYKVMGEYYLESDISLTSIRGETEDYYKVVVFGSSVVETSDVVKVYDKDYLAVEVYKVECKRLREEVDGLWSSDEGTNYVLNRVSSRVNELEISLCGLDSQISRLRSRLIELGSKQSIIGNLTLLLVLAVGFLYITKLF